MFGCKNHIGIDKAHGLIRTWDASAANTYDGARLPVLVSKDNSASGVWADTAYRSKKTRRSWRVPCSPEAQAAATNARADHQSQ